MPECSATVHVRPGTRRDTAWPDVFAAGGRWQPSHRRSTSSMPSAANPGSNGAANPIAAWASTRCTAVSCAIRRNQKPSVRSHGHHVAAGAPARAGSSTAISDAAPIRYQSTGSAAPGEQVQSAGRAPRVIQRVTIRWIEPTCTSRSPTVIPGHAGTARSGGARSAATAKAEASTRSALANEWASINAASPNPPPECDP